MSRASVILLRGLARESGHWGDFTNQFKDSWGANLVHTLDLPGSGEFATSPAPIHINESVDFLQQRSQERWGGEAKVVVALSLGGMVALDWICRHPESVSAVVLINSSTREKTAFYQRLRWQVWPDFIKILATADIARREKRILEIVCNSKEARERLYPIWLKLAQEGSISPANFLRQLMAGLKYSPDFALARQRRGAILVGMGDRLVDPQCSDSLSQNLDWPIYRHPWSGHDLPGDDPGWVISTIAKFLET